MDTVNNKCSICFKPLTLYGSISCKNGILCRDCAGKCSPFLSEQQIMEKTVAEMREHLEYREKNRELLKNLHFHKAVEGRNTLYVDDSAEYFLLGKSDDLVNENCDVFRTGDIEDILVTRSYQSDNEDSVNINLSISMNNPQIRNARIRINLFPDIQRNSNEYKQAIRTAALIRKNLKNLMGGNV